MFHMYLGSVISNWSSTFWYFLYQVATESWLLALALAIERFVTPSLTFNFGYLFRRKANHFLPASLHCLLKPSKPLASAKSWAIFLTSLEHKGNPKNETLWSSEPARLKERTYMLKGMHKIWFKSHTATKSSGSVYLHALWEVFYCSPCLLIDARNQLPRY